MFQRCDAIATVSSVGGVLPHTYSWDIGQIGNFMPDTQLIYVMGGTILLLKIK